MLCLCEVGDEIITVTPNFPPTMDLIEGLGFKKVLLKLSFDNAYQIVMDELFSKITSKTKLIILVSPLNPTGTTIPKEELKNISNRLQEEYPNCKLLIDETYREATYGDNAVIPTCAGLGTNVISISSLSKCHGTPGLRLGWLQSSDAAFLEQVKIAKMNTVISNSVLDELVGIEVLKKEAIIFQTRRIHSSQGLQLTSDWIIQNKNLIAWNEPKAGALCCVRLKEEKFNQKQVEAFYTNCKELGIQIASGVWFGETNQYFRLGFGYMDIESLKTTLDTLTEILSKVSES
jgi:aspartate/methionine/tyrosine aminotransferase